MAKDRTPSRNEPDHTFLYEILIFVFIMGFVDILIGFINIYLTPIATLLFLGTGVLIVLLMWNHSKHDYRR